MTREIFKAWDYLVVASMLTVSVVIGVIFRFSGGRQKTASEYLMAGRNMAILPVVVSLTATTQTAVGTLGFPGEIYQYGASLFWYPLGFLVALIICIFVYTPVYFGLQVTSAYEYLELRFGRVTRSIISALYIIQMVLFMSVGLYSPAIALSAVSGLSHYVSILAVGVVCAVYCTLGGMKAVLWTDVFQSLLMWLALMSVIVKGCLDLGGFTEMASIARAGGRLDFIDLRPDPTLRFTLMTTLIGGFMYGMTTNGVNQTQVQRLLTLSTLRRSQLALLLSIPLNLLFYYTIFMCGVVIYANFAGCDPLLQEESGIASADQLIPYYMIKSFITIPGMAGFCVSGVFCAALTSISSAVNSLAAVTTEDFVKPFCNCTTWLNDSKGARISKFFALFYSVVCIGMTYLVGKIEGIIQAAFMVFTAIGGPTLAIITLGMLTSAANQKGILIGLLSGVALNAWIGTGSMLAQYPQNKLPQSISSCDSSAFFSSSEFTTSAFTPSNTTVTDYITTSDSTVTIQQDDVLPVYKLSFYLHPVPGTLLTLLVGYIVSIITGGTRNLDERLLSTFVRKGQVLKPVANGDVGAKMAEDVDVSNGICNKNCKILEESKL